MSVTARRATAGPLDCPDTCSLEVTVEDGRLVAIDAGPANPLTQGFICAKVKHHARRVYAPERVLTPLVRVGAKGAGDFRSATWDEALDLVASRVSAAIAKDGPSSVVPYLYNSSCGEIGGGMLGPLLWDAIGASQVDHTICAATTGRAWSLMFGGMTGADPLDVVHSQLVVVWGANPSISNTHFPPLVQHARSNGAVLVVVDPRRTGMARGPAPRLAARHRRRFVLGMVRHLDRNGLIDRSFVDGVATGADAVIDGSAEWTLSRTAEVTGVDAADIAAFAEELATIRPAFVRIGWGIERNRNGGASYRAVLALPVLTGQLGVLGSGVMASLSGADEFALNGPPQAAGGRST